MSVQTGNLHVNRILANVVQDDYLRLQEHLRPISLKLGQCLEAACRRVDTVYFPYSDVVTMIAATGARRHQAEVGVIGFEGMTGMSVVLGTEPPPCSTFVQIEGSGVCLTADNLRRLLDASSSLRQTLLRYVHVLATQSAFTALANAKASVEQRVARWLLMAQDRIPGNGLQLTHEFLSLMLGVRRAGVTTALHQLESQSLISTGRGSIVIVDRAGLENRTEGFYGGPELELARLMPV